MEYQEIVSMHLVIYFVFFFFNTMFHNIYNRFSSYRLMRKLKLCLSTSFLYHCHCILIGNHLEFLETL